MHPFVSGILRAQLPSASYKPGFSLIELMVALSVTAVLLASAAPSFGSLVNSTRVSVQSNHLLESLLQARAEAVNRHKLVQICQMDDVASLECSSDYSSYRNWSVGWMIFEDTNGNNNYDSNDEIIRVEQGNEHVQLVFNQRGRLRFFPDGRARSAGFTVCGANQRHYRHIYLLHTGRARVDENATDKQKAKCNAMAAKNSV